MQSKDQLKQLRIQKAAAAQQVALVESQRKARAAAVAAAAAQLRPKAAAGMPPPAPRAPSGSMPAATSSKAAVSSSSARPQAALIRPKPPQTGQRSVNGAVQEPARPSGMLNDLMPCHVMHALVLLCLLGPTVSFSQGSTRMSGIRSCPRYHMLTVSQLYSLLV